MYFTLPIDSGKTINVYGTITHEIPFQSVRFFHGSVPAVEGISSTEGTFSAAVYQNRVSAVVQYSGHVQFELTYSSFSMDPYTSSPPLVLQQVNVTEKYVSKESQDYAFHAKTMEKTVVEKKHLRIRQLQTAGTARLKILVLYTKQAVDYCGDENCLLLHITLAIGNFNIALQNSLVDMTVDYVAERIQEYDTFVEDSDMGVMLSRMGSTISTDRRNVLGCHAVHLTTSNTMYCGISSYSFDGLTDGYSASFFGCIGGYMTLAHEVGHNIGLHHDPSGYGGNTPNRAYCWDDSTGLGNCHRSILSYGGCVTPNGRTNCDRVKYFSTPDVREMGNVVGGAMFNNAQQLRNNIFPFMGQFTPFFVVPTGGSTEIPSDAPTEIPTEIPTEVPTEIPTKSPSLVPTKSPTISPSMIPSMIPSLVPTKSPSLVPTKGPSLVPTKGPSLVPTKGPSWGPTGGPMFLPSIGPSLVPSRVPTGSPMFLPSRAPTMAPTMIITLVAPSFFIYIVISSSVFFCFLFLCFCYYHRLERIKKSQTYLANSDGDVTNPWYNKYDFEDIYKPLEDSNGTFESSMGRISPSICNDPPSVGPISNIRRYKRNTSQKSGSFYGIQPSFVEDISHNSYINGPRSFSKTNSLLLLKHLNASRPTVENVSSTNEPLSFLPEKRMSIGSSVKHLSTSGHYIRDEDEGDDRDTVTFGISSKSVVKKR